jgi:hypothetical protein
MNVQLNIWENIHKGIRHQDYRRTGGIFISPVNRDALKGGAL